MKPFNSETLDLKSRIILVGISSAFIAIFLFVLANAFFSENDEWMFFGDIWILNILGIILVSIIISIWYFYRDWIQYRNLSVELKEKTMTFSSEYTKTETFNYHELMSYRIIKTLYGFRRYRKLILFFRSKKTQQKVKKTLLLKDYQTEDLIKAIKSQNKQVIKT